MNETPPSNGDSYYLFTSFRKRGEDGVYLALSRDGYHWTSLSQDKPFISIEELKTGQVRDPCIGLAPDGTFHLVWTSGGNPSFGYARSQDLIHWHGQREIEPMGHEPDTRNTWAPELFYDEENAQWLILWSSTIVGRWGDTPCLPGWEGFNQRIFGATTRDFETFSDTRLFFDPGYTCIDAAIAKAHGRYYLLFKDERFEPRHLTLRLASSDHLEGPYENISEALTPEYTEGASALEIGDYFTVYYDRYWQPQFYGAIRTKDFQTWEDVTSQMSFPPDHRHGSVVQISGATARGLLQSPQCDAGAVEALKG